MAYKSILLNADTYSRVSMAKRRLEARLQKRLSFGDLFNEVFGKDIEFADIDEDLRDYIKSFCGSLSENRNILGILLFGSVAKGHGYNRYSDIDLLVVASDRKAATATFDFVHKIKKELYEKESALSSKQLPTFISPIIFEVKELDKFKPIYLDFLDYGIILFERYGTLTTFLAKMRKIRHKREFNPYEVLSWQI